MIHTQPDYLHGCHPLFSSFFVSSSGIGQFSSGAGLSFLGKIHSAPVVVKDGSISAVNPRFVVVFPLIIYGHVF